MHPFMVAWATPLYSAVFDEFARAGIVSVGGWHFDASIFNTRRPYRYDVLMDGSRSAQVIADYYCKKMAGKNATLAGDPTMRAFLHTWRTLLAQAVEIDVYEDVTDAIE